MVSRFWLLLLAAAAMYLLANGSVPLWDRDEPRYAQTSKQMVESGDWVFPKLLDQPRLAKPIFIYWCQAASMKVFGGTDWAARLPSVIAALLTVAMLYFAIRKDLDPQHAIWTAFIFATSALTIMAAKMSITDAVLTLFITCSQLCLYRIWIGRSSWPTIVAFGLAIGFAGLTKGPVVLGVLATTLLILWLLRKYDSWQKVPQTTGTFPRLADEQEGDVSEPPSGAGAILKSLLVVALVIIVVAPWVIAMERRQPGYLVNTINSQVVERIKTPQEGHKGPPGFYLFTVWGTYFPWSLLLPAALVQGWKKRGDLAVRFAFAAIVGPWIMFECFATKLPHYVLPTFPFIAFLTANMLIRASRNAHPDITSDAFVKLVRMWSVLVAILGSVLWICVPMFLPISWRGILALLFCSIISAEYVRHVYLYFRARKVLEGSFALGVGWLIIFACIYGGFLPAAWFLQISPRVAAVLNREMKPTDNALMIDYKETSLPFYQGGSIRPQRENDYLQKEDLILWPNYLVITKDVWKTVPPDIQDRWIELENIHGLSYADGGRTVDVLVLKKRPQ